MEPSSPLLVHAARTFSSVPELMDEQMARTNTCPSPTASPSCNSSCRTSTFPGDTNSRNALSRTMPGGGNDAPVPPPGDAPSTPPSGDTPSTPPPGETPTPPDTARDPSQLTRLGSPDATFLARPIMLSVFPPRSARAADMAEVGLFCGVVRRHPGRRWVGWGMGLSLSPPRTSRATLFSTGIGSEQAAQGQEAEGEEGGGGG